MEWSIVFSEILSLEVNYLFSFVSACMCEIVFSRYETTKT
jgi:hypothetical protein